MADHKRVISKEEWEKRLAEVKVKEEDLNNLVMNFFVIEGYKEAAEKFREESGTEPEVDLGSIEDRMTIRNYIQAGDVQEAVQRVNRINPDILSSNPSLYFHLQQQRLIELIRSGDLEAVLQFAKEELAPHGEESEEILDELEKTMALLAFEDPSKISQIADLLENSQRQKTASELNSAILEAQCQDREPKLPTLLKMLVWAQSKLEEKCVFPKIKDLSNPSIE